MKAVTKISVFVLIPLTAATAVGIYVGYPQYFFELKNGSDAFDAFRWAFIAGLFYSPIGLLVGSIIDLFIWMILTPPKHLRQNY